jgi:hypothetical protein
MHVAVYPSWCDVQPCMCMWPCCIHLAVYPSLSLLPPIHRYCLPLLVHPVSNMDCPIFLFPLHPLMTANPFHHALWQSGLTPLFSSPSHPQVTVSPLLAHSVAKWAHPTILLPPAHPPGNQCSHKDSSISLVSGTFDIR